MKRIFVLALALVLGGLLFGCGTPVNPVDPNKTQVYVSTFAGGLGVDWLNEAAKRFNAKSDDYQVFIGDPSKQTYDEISASIKGNNSQFDIYFTVSNEYEDLALGGHLENLNDVLSMRPDGAAGKTVLEKMNKSSEFMDVFSLNQNGAVNAYALPYAELIFGFVIDYTIFEDSGWLCTDGDGKLTKGLDGIEGNHDDGWPVTIAEFDEMLARIDGDNVRAFNFAGKYSDMLKNILEAVWAMYDGIDNYEISFGYEGTYKPKTGAQFDITTTTGYLADNMQGKLKGLEFVNKYFISNSSYVTTPSTLGTTTHTVAQENYIKANIVTNLQKSAIHIDGEWWENEARPIFKLLSDAQYSDYAFGVRDYRMMAIPAYEGSYGLDANGGGAVVPVHEFSNVFLKKQANTAAGSKIAQGAKEFLAYTLSDEILRLFTTSNGCMRPYDYTLTAEDMSKLTKFGKSVLALRNNPSVELINAELLKYHSPLNYKTQYKPSRWTGSVSNVLYADAYLAMSPTRGGGASAAAYLNAIKQRNITMWPDILAQLD